MKSLLVTRYIFHSYTVSGIKQPQHSYIDPMNLLGDGFGPKLSIRSGYGVFVAIAL